MFRFGSVELLFGLLLVPLLALLLWHGARARTRALDRFGDSELVQRLAASVHRRNRTLRTLLFVGSVGLLLTALARPQFGTRVETVRREGKDVVVALDLSRSMLAEDIAPNRLQRAKLEILRLLDRLEGDRVGLVAFAGQAFVQSPLTTDYAATQLFLSAMDVDLVPVQGRTWRGDERRARPLRRGGARVPVLLIVTDGEDHEGEVAEAIRRANDSAVRVFTVGIGSPDGVPIPEFDAAGNRQGFQRDADGNVVTTRLDEATLRRIADATGGGFYLSTPQSVELDALIDEMSAVGTREIDAREIAQFEEQFQLFLGAAILLLLIEPLLPARRRGEAGRQATRGREVPNEKPDGVAADGRRAVDGWRAARPRRAERPALAGGGANRLYAEGRFAEAHEMYLEALRENPGSPLIRFNEGNALYQSQEFERALEAYRDAIESGDTALAEGAWYNLGNSLFRQQQLDASLEAYKQALRINPGDTDAKHNLERVLEQMEEQENQQDQQDQNQDDQNQENQDQQQPPPEGDPQQTRMSSRTSLRPRTTSRSRSSPPGLRPGR